MSTSLVTSPAAARPRLVDDRTSRYLELKGRVHQELLNRLNLDRLTQVSRADAEPEIRNVIAGILDRESATLPLSLFERETVSSDVLDELFGLGPLELLLKDPSISDILVNRADQIYIERGGRLEARDEHVDPDCRCLLPGPAGKSRYAVLCKKTVQAGDDSPLEITHLPSVGRMNTKPCRFP